MLKKPPLNRYLLEKLLKWLDRPEFYAIKGPRQAGKTTLLKILQQKMAKKLGINPKYIYAVTFEDNKKLADFKKNPIKYVEDQIKTLNPKEKHYFFIDEFQYFKPSGKILKLIYDTSENIKFIVTGSSSLELANELGRFMVGRIFSFYLWPLSFAEFLQTKEPSVLRSYNRQHKNLYNLILNNQYRKESAFFEYKLLDYLEEFITYGGYPAVITESDSKTKIKILQEILDNYLHKDIIKLLKITNTDVFYKLIEILAQQTGNLINYDSLTRDSESYFKEVKHFLSITEETYIIKHLRPYYKNAQTELKKNPKIYFIDSGLRNYLINNFLPLKDRADNGALVENFVYTELIKNLPENFRIKYWRSKSKAEVDFIIDKVSSQIPVEVKFSSFDKPAVSKSFRSFIETYKPSVGLILTRDFWGKIKIDATEVYFMPVYYI